MRNVTKSIQAMVDSGDSDVYNLWKARRSTLIMQIGDFLIKESEKDLNLIFEEWEAVIMRIKQFPKTRHKLNALMIISLLHHFQLDLDQIKGFLDFIYDILQDKNQNIVKAATETIQWIAKESPEGAFLFVTPIQKALLWLIDQKDTHLHINSLIIIHKAMRFSAINLSYSVLSNFNPIFSLVCCDNLELRRLAVKVVGYCLRHISFKSNKEIFHLVFQKSFSKLKSNECTSATHGVILLLRILFKLQSNLFDIGQDFIVPPVYKMAIHEDINYMTDAVKFMNRLTYISPNVYSQISISKVASNLIRHNTDVRLLDKFIRAFKTHIDVKQIIMFCENQILATSSPKRGFDILTTMIKLFPKCEYKEEVFQKIITDQSDSFLKCLEARGNLNGEVFGYISQFTYDNLSLDVPPWKSILALKFVQLFPKELFPSSDHFLDVLSPFSKVSNEKVRLEVVRAGSCFYNKRVVDLLVFYGLNDTSKSVRFEAIHRLIPNKMVSGNPMIIEMFADCSYRVKRASLLLISEVMKYNPFDCTTIIKFGIQNALVSMRSISDIKLYTKIASLLPIFTEHCLNVIQPFSDDLITVCLEVLNTNIKYGSTIHRDTFSDPNSAFSRLETNSGSEPLRFQIYKILKEKCINRRDGYCLQALANLGSNVIPYIDQIMNVFYEILRTKTSESLLIIAVNALATLVGKIGTGMNLRYKYPKIIPVLKKLLSPAYRKEVAIAVIQLLGKSCDSLEISADIEPDYPVSDLTVDMKNPSYFTDFVMTHLIPFFDQPTLQLYETVTLIFECRPNYTAKFFDKIFPLFLRGIDNLKEKHKSSLFEMLEIITLQCPNETLCFLDSLTQTLLRNIDQICGIRFCASLSIRFLSSFIPVSSALYIPAKQQLIQANEDYFKYCVRFLLFCVLYQNQSLEIFLDGLERRMLSNSTLPKNFNEEVSNSLTILIQNKDVSIYRSRFARFAQRLYQIDSHSKYIANLINSLLEFSHLPDNVIEYWFSTFKPSKAYQFNAYFEPSRNIPIPIQFEEKINFFKLINRDVNELNITKFFDDLCTYVVSNSPDPVIRCCLNAVNSLTNFRRVIFPVAFLSCWKYTDSREKDNFAQFIQTICQSNFHVNQVILDIAQILDRASIPLNIDNILLAKVSYSKPLSLYFLQKSIRDNRSNINVIENLLEVNTSMGRNSSAMGLLIDAKHSMDAATSAKWCELLHDWEGALELYDDVSKRIRCHAHLEQWGKIRKLESIFTKMTTQEMIENAPHFAWAFYHSGELEKAANYLKYFPKDPSMSNSIFKALWTIKIKHFKKAQKVIQECFELIAQDKLTYQSGDIHKSQQNISTAQLLVELQETLDTLQSSNTQELSSVWNKRLKNFKRDSDTWIKLIEIRNLTLSPEHHVNVYLKMISALRNERKWKLIDRYFERSFNSIFSIDVEYAKAKIFWAKGNRKEAIDTLKTLLAMLDEKFPPKVIQNMNESSLYSLFLTIIRHPSFNSGCTKQELVNKFHEKPREFLNDLIQNPGVKPQISKIISNYDSYFESRLYRTLGNYLFAEKPVSLNSLEEITKLFDIAKEKGQNDYRNWNGWAVANSTLADMNPDHPDIFLLNAVSGFLKATSLKSSNTLAFLCQMFAMFFKIKDSSLIPESTIQGLYELQPSILYQMMPQLTSQIIHPDEVIRDIVHNLLMRFGQQHFQALFFHLNLYTMSDNKQKAKYASDMLNELGHLQQPVFEDAKLFVDGLLSAAYTVFDVWISHLESARHLYYNGELDEMDKVLRTLFSLYRKPSNFLELKFQKTYQKETIEKCIQQFERHSTQSLKNMWLTLTNVLNDIKNILQRIDCILLQQVNEPLAAKRNFSICVPGTYSCDHPVPTIEMIDQTIEVLKTGLKPRGLHIQSSDGTKVKFLLKSNEDLRLDQRVMQFFSLINSLIKHSRLATERQTSIVEYAIIPLSPDAGLIYWLYGTDTINDIVLEYRSAHDIPEQLEYQTILSFTGVAKESASFDTMNQLQRQEAYQYVAPRCPATEIRDNFWAKAPNAATWVNRSRNFCLTTALMSMIGYIIGLGDRHPSNIMIQKETGQVIHIDFGESFEVNLYRQLYPEKVPFRLTRMIVNALDGGGIEGMFRKMCEDIMWILRDNRNSIISLLEIFIHDPQSEQTSFMRPKFKSPTKIIDRVHQKLTGRDIKSDKSELSVEDQVDILIRTAMDHNNYITHFIGWCPFW